MRLSRAVAPDETDDHLWVAATLAGDPAAFRVLFDRHAGAVRRFLRDLGRDEALADTRDDRAKDEAAPDAAHARILLDDPHLLAVPEITPTWR